MIPFIVACLLTCVSAGGWWHEHDDWDHHDHFSIAHGHHKIHSTGHNDGHGAEGSTRILTGHEPIIPNTKHNREDWNDKNDHIDYGRWGGKNGGWKGNDNGWGEDEVWGGWNDRGFRVGNGIKGKSWGGTHGVKATNNGGGRKDLGWTGNNGEWNGWGDDDDSSWGGDWGGPGGRRGGNFGGPGHKSVFTPSVGHASAIRPNGGRTSIIGTNGGSAQITRPSVRYTSVFVPGSGRVGLIGPGHRGW